MMRRLRLRDMSVGRGGDDINLAYTSKKFVAIGTGHQVRWWTSGAGYHVFVGGKGHRTAIKSILDDGESCLLKGRNNDPLRLLTNLRRQGDGNPDADRNDRIADNAGRMQGY